MRKLSAILMITTMLLLSAIQGFAIENNVKISVENENEIRTNLNELGIYGQTQDNLINKLREGMIWDCMDKNKVSKIPKNFFDLTESNPVKRYVFADGSVIEKKMEILSKKVLVKKGAISGGDTSSGTGYFCVKKAKISTRKGLVGMGFFADYCSVNGGNDYISSVYDEWIKVIGGSSSTPSLKIVKKKENLNGPAKAKLTAQVSYVGDIAGSGTEWLYLCVGDDRAWTTEN